MATDSLVTLDEALAFIDLWDDESAAESTSGTGTTDDLLTFEGLDGLLNAASPPRKKKRVRKASSSSTTLQRRKKAEIEALRQEASQLEGYLGQLERRKGCGSGPLDRLQTPASELVEREGSTMDWHSCAIAEYRERLQAEQTSVRLKEVSDRLQKLRKQLSGILQHEDMLRGYEFVKKLSSPVLHESYFTVDYTSTIVSQLQQKVTGLYQDFDQVFQRPQQPPIICTRSEPKYDEKTQSRALEIVTTTPLESSVNAVVDAFWASLSSTYAKGSKPNSLQGDRSVNLDHRGCAVHFDKLYFLRKFEEDDRVILVWSCFFLSSAKLQYRTLGYTVVAPAEINPSRGCVVHSELKLHMEYRGELPAKGFEEAHNMALGALSRMLRRFWNAEQNRLVNEAARVA